MSLRTKLGQRPDEWNRAGRLRWVVPSAGGLGGAAGAFLALAVEPWALSGAVTAGLGAGLGAALAIVFAAALD
ncbi:hypothetical protein C475_09042 [Halosimplex carlsbadense 2-9-1]|uniref:Uncharacterized protein n=1 Tax=Halosimplex carlsbadense 2-9-1 TaxID=797114 RepID=M0CUN5_9EURY|nr:hypothetical protein [Halosimplex carlsbadense]ELZ26353.1 hypothetical protein C475_09042 [Halosimplex carlsbadense 2-9-1]